MVDMWWRISQGECHYEGLFRDEGVDFGTWELHDGLLMLTVASSGLLWRNISEEIHVERSYCSAAGVLGGSKLGSSSERNTEERGNTLLNMYNEHVPSQYTHRSIIPMEKHRSALRNRHLTPAVYHTYFISLPFAQSSRP